MSRTQKILTTILWGLLVLVMVSVIGAGWWRSRPAEADAGDAAAEEGLQIQAIGGPQRGDVYFKVPSFALVDQNNDPVTDQSLRGKPWVAAFIFTRCAGPCPMMSANMARLQERVPDPDLRLVSFTVDPERDTPAVLKEYAKNLKADESRWSFLTGAPDAMTKVARGMLMPFTPATETSDITHSTRFLLVDADGNVRGVYSADEMDALATDAAKLADLDIGSTGDGAPAASAAEAR